MKIPYMDLLGRIVKPMIWIIFWLLLFGLASGQQQDSTLRVDSLSAGDTFTDWKTFIAQKGRILDSIKRNQAWERATPQEAEVDTAIRQLQLLCARSEERRVGRGGTGRGLRPR